ncbi:MAG: TonB-dependent receptor, partial [Acidobacteria bacterium]|nr:TonB-dependent receptor [Acidobacteriota bacterium]
DVTRLALLAPAVTRAPGSAQMAANGQRARNNNFTIDGVDNNDLSVTQSNNRVIPEAVAEVQVQTAAYAAEFGRNSGAQIAVLTRGGTNRFHGEWFELFKAGFLEPLSLLNERAGLNKTPRFSQHDTGGALGGPLAKNRTFFFGLLETNRLRQAPDARNASSVTIPTPGGYAALSRVPPASGQTPASRQAALDALAFLPEVYPAIPRYDNLQNIPVNGVPVQMGTVRIPLSNPFDFWFIQGRVDHRRPDGDNFSYRAQIDQRNQPNLVSNLGFGELFAGAQAIRAQNHELSHSRGFGPRLWNEFRAGYVRRNLDFQENAPRAPTVAITGYFTIGGASGFPQGRISNKFQFTDAATWLLGRHALRFGADVRRNRLYNRDETDSKGTWIFNSLADFVNNQAFSLTQAIQTASFDACQTAQFYFFQDDIKVTRHLTLNLGLRYEVSGVPFGLFGAETPEVAAAGVPLPVRPDRNNWAPRLGLAYSPSKRGGLLGDGETVFRGGYGVGYDVLFYNILSVNAGNYPRVVVQTTNQPATLNLFPALAPPRAVTPRFDPLATFVNSPAGTQNPSAHFYSFSIQRQVRKDWVFELGYTGSRSYHALRQGQANPGVLSAAQAAAARAGGSIPSLQSRRLNPLWGQRVLIESTALGSYNALIARFDKRFSHGLLVGANYTFSANLSDSDESLGVVEITNSSPQVPQDFFNYRNEWSRSVFDRPHRFAIHYVYQIPWFRARLANRFGLKHVFRGWSLAGVSDWQSGQPFTVRTGVDSGGTGTTMPFRPDYNPGGIFTPDPVSGDLRTFHSPIDGTGIFLTPLTSNRTPLANSMAGGGNLGRNTFRGPAFTIWNVSLAKRIHLPGRIQATLRADWYNSFNHRNFGNPTALMAAPAFGTNTTDPGGRTMFAALKLGF